MSLLAPSGPPRAGPVLVMGFGPFLEVVDNPSARLAALVDGRSLGPGLPSVVGRPMPVSYERSVACTLDAVLEVGPCLVVGVGVARTRTGVSVEAWGRREVDPDLPDVDGKIGVLAPGPSRIRSTAPTAALAVALGAVVSGHAGRYVCNAWLYRVQHALSAGPPVAFVHVPGAGLAPERLCEGLRACVVSPEVS